MSAPPNVDDFVDYKTEYMAVVKRPHISGNSVVGLCPFHDDSNASFSADISTGKWTCFAEGRSGNFISFWAELHGVDTKVAYQQICDKYHVDRGGGKRRKEKKEREAYTLEQYAMEKGMPSSWLRQFWHLETIHPANGPSYVSMPYAYQDGSAAQIRRRFANKDIDFKRDRSEPKKVQALYGEQFLHLIKDQLIIVEGESDTQSIWYMNVPQAVGVAGAQNFNKIMAGKVAAKGLPVLVHIEKDRDGAPDSGGQVFASQVPKALGAAGFTGEAKLWSCRDIDRDTKDPSDVLIKYGDVEGRAVILRALQAAVPVDMSEWETKPLTDPPIELKTPEGWDISDAGIRKLDTDSKKGSRARPEALLQDGPQLVTSTPILILARIRPTVFREEQQETVIESDKEAKKERIELAFRMDGKWQTGVFNRSTLFTSRTIVALSDYGCDVSSENAKDLVNFLTALMRANKDSIPVKWSTDTLGWQDDETFIPGVAGELVVDMPQSHMDLYRSMKPRGTLSDWVEMIRPFRGNTFFRMMLAAGFGAPLLKILDQRSFTLYIWHRSGGGKTIGMLSAMSIWGNPSTLSFTFNATVNYIERRARITNDLPLGIDERQQAARGQLTLDQILYLIANGKVKGRANKDAEIKDVSNERGRIIGIATGEQQMTSEVSQEGATRRLLVIHGRPFDDEQEASDMYAKVARCYGSAGPAFVKRLIKNKDKIKAIYDEIASPLKNAKGNRLAHAAYAAVLGTADFLSGVWLFGEDPETAIFKARRLAYVAMEQQVEYNTDSNIQSAPKFILDWISEHETNFSPSEYNRGPIYGWYDEKDNDIIYINPKSLREAMEKGSLSFDQVKYELRNMGIIETNNNGLFTVTRRRRVRTTDPTTGQSVDISQVQRVVMINLEALRGYAGVFEEDTTAEEPSEPQQIDFSELMDPEEDNPFVEQDG